MATHHGSKRKHDIKRRRERLEALARKHHLVDTYALGGR